MSARVSTKPPLRLLRLKDTPIFKQLQIEEALLRADDRQWCVLNRGSLPAIVMGISGKHEQDLHLDEIHKQQIPVIKRFSGGGTVVVDEDTLFVTFLGNKSWLGFEPFPEPLMRWSGDLYEEVFLHPEFSLRENDYAIGQRKIGGNAQYLQKTRWLHHTSWLWDFKPSRMACLAHPKKTPQYRQGRNHLDFLSKLCHLFSSEEAFFERLIDHLDLHYDLSSGTIEEVSAIANRPHRKATEILSI